MIPRVVSREPLPPDEAKWTKLVKVTYEDADGTPRVWESAERTTKPPATDQNPESIDGVDIVAVVRGDAQPPQIVLIKQFRPAVGRTVIELPAGLVDAGESVEMAAVRELREETGYVGRVTGNTASSLAPSLPLFADPGFGNNSLQIVYVDVDAADPRNQPRATGTPNSKRASWCSKCLLYLWPACLMRADGSPTKKATPSTRGWARWPKAWRWRGGTWACNE